MLGIFVVAAAAAVFACVFVWVRARVFVPLCFRAPTVASWDTGSPSVHSCVQWLATVRWKLHSVCAQGKARHLEVVVINRSIVVPPAVAESRRSRPCAQKLTAFLSHERDIMACAHQPMPADATRPTAHGAASMRTHTHMDACAQCTTKTDARVHTARNLERLRVRVCRNAMGFAVRGV